MYMPAGANEGCFGQVDDVALLSLVREQRTLREVAVVRQKMTLDRGVRYERRRGGEGVLGE